MSRTFTEMINTCEMHSVTVGGRLRQYLRMIWFSDDANDVLSVTKLYKT